MDKLLPCIYDLRCSIDNSLIQKLSRAHHALGLLTGMSQIIPNKLILLNTLPLQEAQGSSAIENIITTTEELYREDESLLAPSAKEVKGYGRAIMFGYESIEKQGYLNNGLVKKIQEMIIGNNAGFRKTPGTVLKNDQGETVYVPPQSFEEISALMDELEKYINDAELEVDPLIKMALIHYQFESIHPFYDGRTGRIVNILFLIQENLLDSPILYLSRYIVKHKSAYYHLLKKMEDSGNFYEWVEFMLDCVIATAESTMESIQKINELLIQANKVLKEFKISRRRDLIDHIFLFPITTRRRLEKELKISYITAGKYLNQLKHLDILHEDTYKGILYYHNKELFHILSSPIN